MAWPSERVRPGGIFQPAKTKYSPETQNFIKVLLDESKLTMLQRKKINYALRSGESLPLLNETTNSARKQSNPRIVTERKFEQPVSPRRRSFTTIVQSGAYEREKFRSTQPIRDREKSIERLQNLMYYGKNDGDKKKPEKLNKKKKNKQNKKQAESYEITFEHLQKEIEERQNFLNEMEKLGEGVKYRQVINQQITALLKEMEDLNVNHDIQKNAKEMKDLKNKSDNKKI